MRPRTLRHARAVVMAFVLYAVITAAAMWPMASSPGSICVPAPDTYVHAWGLAAVVRQVLNDPLHLYAANSYWPNPNSMAYNELLLPQALMALPVFLLGGGPLLAHNLVLLLTFPMAATSMFVLARAWTRSTLGAFLAGMIYAFSAYQLGHLVQIEILSVQWLPLVVLFGVRAVRRPRPRTLVALALCCVLQALSSGYYAVLMAATLLVIGAAFFGSLRRGAWRPVGLALAVAAAVVAMVSWPQVERLRVGGARDGSGDESFARSREICVYYSARPATYLAPHAAQNLNLPHLGWLWWRFSGMAGRERLFPGSVAVLLAILGVWRGRRMRFPLLCTAAGLVLSLGPEITLGSWTLTGPYELLRMLPVASLMRAPSRFAVLALLGIALLAAIGFRWLQRRRAWAWLVALLLMVELYPSGLRSFRAPAPAPPSTEWLARASRGPVLELPWNDRTRQWGGSYLLWSTAHWQPMVNGLGSFEPANSLAFGRMGRRFPRADVVRRFREAGIRYVVVHADLCRPEDRRMLRRPLPRGVRLAARFQSEIGETIIYVLDPPTAVAATPALDR